MAWEHLSINKPHLVYIILGAFTSLFMLCSSVIKERLYIGEATVATLCGIIFGPHAAGLIDPGTWGNTDQITLEFSRLVLVIQCFAVGVELPKAYMERHWRSVVFLLVPVMTFGWLITSLFIWAVFNGTLNWLDSLCVAACVTATDPVLASSVVGKGKFAKRVPKHLRDLLSAESGCNDGMAFPFVYLAIYIIRYYGHPDEVALHWFCYTILYECLFGAIYGVTIGYIARRLIRYAHEHNLIDRESFLVYYFVLALFCAGSGSLLGMDDLLIGFACGVGFSNDGWFTHQTEESHVSNVIDLLINLAFFVYFGTIIPWAQFNSGIFGMYVWKLVVIGILVLLFRRIPIMMALKPLIPDVKTWREALFAGHFGPIGVGAIFVAILARAELETGEVTPLQNLPPADAPYDNVIVLIWPIVTFLVICSIIVHGSSIAVFTLGKHINTLTLTMSYTQASEQGPSWMDRLPRIQSRAKTQTSDKKGDDSDIDEKEKRASPSDFPAGFPILRRVREDDKKGSASRNSSRAPSRHRSRHSKNWEHGPGGPISQGAIGRDPRQLSKSQSISRSDSETLANKDESPDTKKIDDDDTPPESQPQTPGEIYEEGGNTVYEDEEGNVLAVERTNEKGHEREEDEEKEGRRLMHKEAVDRAHGMDPTEDESNMSPGHESMNKAKHAEEQVDGDGQESDEPKKTGLSRLTSFAGGLRNRGAREQKARPKAESGSSRGPARAYQYGNTIIVEDEDGEVIKKYDIPAPDRQSSGQNAEVSKHRIGRMSKMFGLSAGGEEPDEKVEPGAPGVSKDGAKAKRPEARRMFSSKQPQPSNNNEDNDGVRFTVDSGGRRMSAAQFISYIGSVDPRTRVQVVEDSSAPEPIKEEARKEAREQAAIQKHDTKDSDVPVIPEDKDHDLEDAEHHIKDTKDDGLKLVDSNDDDVPFHDISSQLKKHSARSGESAAERRRRLALQRQTQEEDSDDDGTERKPPRQTNTTQDDSDDDGTERKPPRRTNTAPRRDEAIDDKTETAAERRRRLGALGQQADHEPGKSKQRQSALRWGDNKRSG